MIYNPYSQMPQDWNDESKYPNKQLLIKTEHVGNAPSFETWEYDSNPSDLLPTHLAISFAKCPYCGEVLNASEYNDISPCLAGSAGIEFTCKCGYKHRNIQIMS